MHPRVQELIQLLNLQPHPEGGMFAEVYRAPHTVQRPDGEHRSSITTIYFLLPAGAVSQWHRVQADEVWHWYEGAPLWLHVQGVADDSPRPLQLGPAGQSHARPVQVVPHGAWQAAHSMGDYTLVGCSVGPGFDFADFVLAHDVPESQRPALPPLPHTPATGG